MFPTSKTRRRGRDVYRLDVRTVAIGNAIEFKSFLRRALKYYCVISGGRSGCFNIRIKTVWFEP